MDHDPLRRGFAEFVGTFALIFVGAGSILALTTQFEPAINGPQAQGVYGGLTLVAGALSHGLVLPLMGPAGRPLRPHPRRPLHPSRDARLPRHAADRADPRARLLERPVPRGNRRSGSAALVLLGAHAPAHESRRARSRRRRRPLAGAG